jgi:hypothetical protein
MQGKGNCQACGTLLKATGVTKFVVFILILSCFFAIPALPMGAFFIYIILLTLIAIYLGVKLFVKLEVAEPQSKIKRDTD